VTDRQTDRQTEFSSLDRVCIPCSAVKTEKQLMRIRVIVDERTCDLILMTFDFDLDSDFERYFRILDEKLPTN